MDIGPAVDRMQIRDARGVGLAEILVGGSLITLRVGTQDLTLTSATATALGQALLRAAIMVNLW